MSTTIYSAHAYVVSEEEQAYFEISFPNEMEPELLIKDTFINDFNDPTDRKALINNSFDANYSWEDEDPYTLENAISDWWDECGIPWFDEEVVAELNEEDYAPNQYDVFCEAINGMKNIKYVLLAIDANKPSHNYGEYWYDAVAYDFVMQRRVMIDWRGANETHEELYGDFPFDEETAQRIVELLEKNQIDSVDTGDFLLNGALYGKVTVKDMHGAEQSGEKANEKTALKPEEDIEETKQIERIASLITNVDEIDFTGKAFVFDRLDYVPINGDFHGPDSPEHPIVKQVIEAGGLMRKAVFGKTDYLVLNNHAVKSGMGKKCKDALEQIDKGKKLTIITVDNLMEVLPSATTSGQTKNTNAQTLTFNKSERVTIDGDLDIFIPDGFHYARDGFGGNQHWLYIVPEDYSLELDHIEAKPLSFGIVPKTIATLPESASLDNIKACREVLLTNNMLQQGVAIKECVCSEHCFFIYQTWFDSKDNKYNKINGVLFAGDRMYQFHTFMNHDKAISDDEKVQRQFELISKLWMKHVVLTGDPICNAKGDPEEVKGTIADVTRIIKQFKESALPALSDDFGDDFKDSYSLIAGMFYLKNGKQIDSSRIQSLRNMLGQDLSKESLMTLLKDNEAQKSSITDIIRAPMHDRVIGQTVLLDKFAGTDVEGGMTWVHLIGVEELLKVLCEENNIDYDLNEFCLECVESIRTLFSEKWESGDAYRLNESTFVIHQRESERRRNKTEKPKEKTAKDKSVKKEKSKQDSEKEKKSIQRKISYRKREIETLSSELEQLKNIGDKKEDQAKYIEKVLEERYRNFHEYHPVDWSQEPEITKLAQEADNEFNRLKKEYKRKHDNEFNEIKSGVYNSLYDPELQYHVERLQKLAEKYIKDLTRVFNRVESSIKRFQEKGISASGMKKLVKVMDAIYEEGEEIKISFNDSVNDVTMVYEYMPVECGSSADAWRIYQENMQDDIEEQDRQKEAKASKSMQQKLSKAQTAYDDVRRRLEDAEDGSEKNGDELGKLEGELEELLNNYDAETIIIEDDFNDAVDRLQRQLEETVQRKDKKIQEKRELEAALEKTVAFAFSKKNKYKEEISTASSEIRQLENKEEDLEERIRKVSDQKERRIKSLDSKISDLGTKIATIRKQIETGPDRIASLKKELETRKAELFEAQQEADSFHIDYLIREHGDILQEMSEQIINKKKRIEKLKGEIAQFENEELTIKE